MEMPTKKGVMVTKKIQQLHEGQINMAKQGPCWEGYVQVGMKKKNGKMVPNCVPESESTKKPVKKAKKK